MDPIVTQQLTDMNIDKILHYFTYFIISVCLFVGFFKAYLKFTPYDEIELIKKGSVAVAWTLSGAILGYVINLGFAMFYSYGVIQFVVFGIASGALQLACHYILQKVFVTLQEEVRTNNNVAVGILFASIAICVGIINGASAY